MPNTKQPEQNKTISEGERIYDATKEKCYECGKPAYMFVEIMFRPSLWGKPFCKKCLKKLEKECGL